MKQKAPLVKAHDTLPIFQRGKNLLLIKTFPGVGQKHVPLKTDNKKTAVSRAKRFLASIELGLNYETACEELHGKKILKPGDDYSHADIEKIFKEYCASLEEPPRDVSITGYLSALKRVMNGKMLSKVDMEEVRKRMLNGSTDASKKRTYIAELRNAKAIFSKDCMAYYKRKNYKLSNPFTDVKLAAPKVEQYTPLPEDIRKSIFNECENQEPEIAMLTLLALEMGFRRNESEHCRKTWFSIQKDHVVVSIKEEDGYTPKSGEKRTFKIGKVLYERLLKQRQKILDAHTGKTSLDNDHFFIPVFQRKGSGKRLDRRFKVILKWLKQMGIKDRTAYHTLRKEAGSLHYLKTKNLLETSRFLGHSDPKVTADVYAGIIDPAIVGSVDLEPEKTKEEQAAELLGMTLEELQKMQGK